MADPPRLAAAIFIFRLRLLALHYHHPLPLRGSVLGPSDRRPDFPLSPRVVPSYAGLLLRWSPLLLSLTQGVPRVLVGDDREDTTILCLAVLDPTTIPPCPGTGPCRLSCTFSVPSSLAFASCLTF